MTTLNNPYFDEAKRMPAYGRYDPSVRGFLAEVSLDPAERLISAVKCNHGSGRVGYLAVTSTRVRWLQRLLFKAHDHWPLGTPMVLRGPFPQLIVLGDGAQFQNRGLRTAAFRDFVSLYQTLVEAMRWEDGHAPVEPVPVVLEGAGIASELSALDRLRGEGLLSVDEFEAAKSKLLGMGA